MTTQRQRRGVYRRLSASLGIVAVSPGSEPAELLAAADRALYQAKRRGRGRAASVAAASGFTEA